MLVDEYLNPVNFDLVTSAKYTMEENSTLEERLQSLTAPVNTDSGQTTVSKVNRNIVQIGLFLEGFGNFAKVNLS